MMRKSQEDKAKIKRLVLILVLCIILLVAVVFLRVFIRERDLSRMAASTETAIEEVTEEQTESETVIDSEGTEIKEENRITISNLGEYATPAMGEEAKQLEESLFKFVSEENLEVTSGSIFYVCVPQSDSESVNYYVQLDDEKSTICLLTYHPREHRSA